MLYETGKVVAVDSDGLWLETLKKSTCAQCSAKAGCGQQLLAKSALSNMTFIKALFPKEEFFDQINSHSIDSNESPAESNGNDGSRSHEVEFSEEKKISYIESNALLADWQVGDIAEIGLNENILVKATIIAYLLPLFMMVIAAIAAAQVWSSDYLVALVSLMGLLLGGSLVRFHASGLFVRLLSKVSFPQKTPYNSCYHALVVRKIQSVAVL